MNWNKMLKSSRFKYGTVSIVLTCAFIALVLALNLLLSSLNLSAGLRVDLSEEEFASVGEDSKAIIDALFAEDENYEITINFCTARDLLESNIYVRYVRDLAETYAEMYPDRISIKYLDISRDPASVDKYLEQAGTAITAGNVIIEGKYHYRILTYDAFYQVNEDNELYAFNGELKFTAAFLQCSKKEPQNVAFTVKHGESVTDSMKLKEIYLDAGYSVTDVDLSVEEIPESTRTLIIYKPTTDFLGYDKERPDAKSEIEKIEEFVAEYNNLLVFVDASTPELPNLQEYLLEYWGLGYKPYHKLHDENKSLQGSDGYAIVGEYIGGTDGYAYQVFKNAVSGSGEKSVFANAVELIADEAKARNGVTVEHVIDTSASAVSRYTYKDGQNTVTEESEPHAMPLMLMSRYMNYKNEGDVHYNTQIYQYVLLVGSTDFASDSYLAKTYANSSLISCAARLVDNERYNPDIRSRKLLSDAIEIETGTAKVLTVMISAVAPVILLIAGIVVFIKRRHM